MNLLKLLLIIYCSFIIICCYIIYKMINFYKALLSGTVSLVKNSLPHSRHFKYFGSLNRPMFLIASINPFLTTDESQRGHTYFFPL